MNTRTAAMLLTLLAAGPALADPPHGTDYDAPETPGDAVDIVPTPSGTTYEGYYHWSPAPDIDFYRFRAGQGQQITVRCVQYVNPWGVWRYPCDAHLFRPDGSPYTEGASTDGTYLHLSVPDADGGYWLLQINGSDPATVGMASPPHPTYHFSLAVGGSGAPSGQAGQPGSGGVIGLPAALALGLGAFLRRRRHG